MSVHNPYEIPDAPGIYFLGCFESRVTLYSQQVRALEFYDLGSTRCSRDDGRRCRRQESVFRRTKDQERHLDACQRLGLVRLRQSSESGSPDTRCYGLQCLHQGRFESPGAMSAQQ